MRPAELSSDGRDWLAVWYDQDHKRRRKCLGRLDKVSKLQAQRKLNKLRELHRRRPATITLQGQVTLGQWAEIYPSAARTFLDQLRRDVGRVKHEPEYIPTRNGLYKRNPDCLKIHPPHRS